MKKDQMPELRSFAAVLRSVLGWPSRHLRSGDRHVSGLSAIPVAVTKMLALLPKMLALLPKMLALLPKMLAVVPKIVPYIVVFLFVAVVYRSLSEKHLIIEPFEVPGSLQAQGYSGRVIANRLMSALIRFRHDVVSKNAVLSEFRTDFRTVESEIDVDAGGFSSKKVTQWISHVFGIAPMRVSGEVTVAGDTLELTARAGAETVRKSGPPGELDSLIHAITPEVIRAVEPYFFALEMAKPNPKVCLAVVEDLIRSDDVAWKPWAYNLWGIVLDQQGRLEEARDKFRRALAFDRPLFHRKSTRKMYAAAHNNLGISFSKQQNNQAAVEHFTKAIQLKPDYASAHANLATILDQAGDHDSALAEYTKAIELTPSNADLYYKRALVYGKKDPAKALADLEFSRTLGSRNVELLYHIGITLKQQRKCSDAERYFDEYVQANGAYSQKAKIYARDCVSSSGGEVSQN